MWELSVLSAQFYCESRTTLKSEVYLKGKKVRETTKHIETIEN